MSKVKQWINDLKILPNEKRGLASGACSSIAMAAALIFYLITETLGYKWSTPWFIGLVIGTEGVATIVFFTWAKAAAKLKEKQHGS